MTFDLRSTVPDLELVSTQATRRILEHVLSEMEEGLNVRISARYIGVSVLKRIGTRGIAADIFIGPSETVDQYASERPSVSMSRARMAVSRSGAAFRSDETIPEIETAEQLIALLQAASAIAYSDGISGTHLLNVLRKYGLDEAISKKRVLPEAGGSAATCVASGSADVGIQQISEMISSKGVTIVELPEEFRRIAAYDAVGIHREGREDAIAAVMRYLTSNEVRDSLADYGLRAPWA